VFAGASSLKYAGARDAGTIPLIPGDTLYPESGKRTSRLKRICSALALWSCSKWKNVAQSMIPFSSAPWKIPKLS